MKSETDIFRQILIYFRKGKSELWFLIGIYNTIQLWYLSEGKVSNLLMIIFGSLIICILFGYIVIKKLETSNPYVNPFTQDTITASLLFYEALKYMILEDREKALFNIEEAIKLRERWVME